jgi:hypothetical protein
MIPRDVLEESLSPDTTKDIPYELQLESSKRKGGDTDEAIFIPELAMNGGDTSTLTRSLENCTLVNRRHIQTAHSATLMSTTYRCLMAHYIRDRLGGTRPIVVRAYVVPGLKHDLLSVEGLNQSGYRVIHDADEEESGVFAVMNKKIDKSKSFPFMSEHSNFPPSNWNR